MGGGAPDYVHLRQILARDALGNLVPVACDPSGRIILLPYGTQTVSQDDPIRTIQGSDGLDLYTIAVDAAGRLIMLPYGWDGVTYRPLKVDDEGRMIGVMKGQADVKWGLRGWWKFVGSEGATIKDYSGFGNNGNALSGAAAEAKYVGGVIGEAINLDGVDDYVTIPDDDSLDIDGEMTIEVWVYKLGASGDDYEHIFYKTGNYYLTLPAVGIIRFVYWASDGNRYLHRSTYIVPIGSWVHLVVVLTSDPSVIRLYVNNELKSTEIETIVQGTNYTNPILIGGSPTSDRQFYGYIDELRMYERALSADEVAWRYEQTNPANPKPTRMIAVDSEGRMLVNIQDLPYKDTVMISEYVNDHAAGTVKIEFDPVPTGKLWVITNVICRCMLDDSGATSLYIRRGDDYYMIGEVMRATQFHTLNFNSHAYLKAGDIIACWFSAVDINKSCQVYVSGYSLDV